MSTPADELRIAAEKIRRLSAAVSAPDERDQAFHADGCDVTQGRSPWMYDVATAQTPELAAFIAAMGPGIGVALADWLDSEADHGNGIDPAALTLARRFAAATPAP
jgi:hypothetical protein